MSNAKYALIIAGLLSSVAAMIITFRKGVRAPLSNRERFLIWLCLFVGFAMVFGSLSMA